MFNAVSLPTNTHPHELIPNRTKDGLSDLITISQAAEILSVSKRTVSRMCLDGKIAAVKVGFQWRINKEKLINQFGLN